LLDVLVASSLGTAVVLAAYGILTTSQGAAHAALQTSQSAAVARQVIENVRQLKVLPITSGTYSDVTVLGPVPQLALMDGGAASLAIAPYNGSTTLVQATVTVTWRAGSTNAAKSCTYATLMTAGGIAP